MVFHIQILSWALIFISRLEWCAMCRNSNIPISGTMLQEEALLVTQRLETEGFTASNGWLEKFKKHHNICNMTVTGEWEGVIPEAVENS